MAHRVAARRGRGRKNPLNKNSGRTPGTHEMEDRTLSRHVAAAELDELYRQYRPFIRGALQRHYVSPEELDDVTQEVFVVLLRKLDEATRPRSAKAWLFQIARRVAANHHRGARRRDRKGKALADIAEVETQRSTDELAARHEARDALAKFIESLDDEACAVFVMSEVEGLRGAEIAGRLGISLPMTYARIRSVRARFDERFGRKNATWAVLLGITEAAVAAAITLAFAIGRKAKIAGAVVLVIGLAWWLRSNGSGPEGGGDGVPPSGGDGAAPPTMLGSADEPPPRAPSDLSGVDALSFVPRGREGVFAGRVVDEDGRGVAGATVCGDRTRTPDHQQYGPPRCTRSDAEGRFAVKGLLAEAHTLAAMAPGFAPGAFHGPPSDEIRIVLHAGGSELAGVVLDVYGGPVADAWVAVENSALETLGATARTDDDGRFSMWVNPGRVSLAAGAADYASSYTTVLAPTSEVELRLGAESIISGTVVDAQHRPMPDVRVSALLVPGIERYANRGGRTYTDAEGKWEIRGLQPHDYILDAAGAQSWGRAAEPVDLGIGDHRSGIEIVMNEGAELIGRIVDGETGEACTDGFVTTLDEQQSITREGRTQNDGWVTVSSLTGGAGYRITVSCRDYLSRELDVELGTGRGEPQEWPLLRGATLAVKAVDGEGEPLPDWMVMIRMPKGAPHVRPSCDAASHQRRWDRRVRRAPAGRVRRAPRRADRRPRSGDARDAGRGAEGSGAARAGGRRRVGDGHRSDRHHDGRGPRHAPGGDARGQQAVGSHGGAARPDLRERSVPRRDPGRRRLSDRAGASRRLRRVGRAGDVRGRVHAARAHRQPVHSAGAGSRAGAERGGQAARGRARRRDPPGDRRWSCATRRTMR